MLPCLTSLPLSPRCAALLGWWEDLRKIESFAEACPSSFYRLGISHLLVHVQECLGGGVAVNACSSHYGRQEL